MKQITGFFFFFGRWKYDFKKSAAGRSTQTMDDYKFSYKRNTEPFKERIKTDTLLQGIFSCNEKGEIDCPEKNWMLKIIRPEK